MMATRFFHFLVSLLVFQAGVSVFAQDTSLLPPAVQSILEDEQTRMLSDYGDPTKFRAHINTQKTEYTPQGRSVFALKSYWVSEKQWHSFKAKSFSGKLQKIFVRKSSTGEREYRFLVHPESEEFFSDILKKAKRAEDFWATATSSSRTLLVWKEGMESLPFFAKLSLDVNIGGWRIMRPAEMVRSVGTELLLEEAAQSLPEKFKFLPEVFSLTPKGADAGGMILREIPNPVLTGEVEVHPLFALFANAEGEIPAFVEMIKNSGLTAPEFFAKYLIEPWAKTWVQMVGVQGINSEDHTQNMLLEIGRKGLPNGKFWHRDFGGFSIDLEYRRAMGLPVPDKMPFIRSEALDYSQTEVEMRVHRVAYYHFAGAVLYVMNKNVPEWIKKGWLPRQKWNPRFAEETLRQTLVTEISRLIGFNIEIGPNYEGLNEAISALKRNRTHQNQKAIQRERNRRASETPCRLIFVR